MIPAAALYGKQEPQLKIMIMRKTKRLFLCLLLVLTSAVQAIGQEKEVFNWDSIIDAIIQVESKGDPRAHNRKGNCVGILQITPTVVKECNNILRMKGSTKKFTNKDRWDVEKSKEMFIIFQEHHNKTRSAEKAFRMWNGGPRYSKAKTNGYLKKCLRYYKK